MQFPIFRVTLFVTIMLTSTSIGFSQPQCRLLDSLPGVSLRGLSVATDSIVWASGSKGTVMRSIDGGQSFERLQIAGYGERDFRDIEAFDENRALIMAVDEPAIMLKTNDGGRSWRKVFEDTTRGMFLDAMFFSADTGIVIGDPVNGKFFIAQTFDEGDSWKTISIRNQFTVPMPGEAFFAASGGNILLYHYNRKTDAVYVSGGETSRIFWSGHLVKKLPILQGKSSTGANAIAIHGKKGIVVGGDFSNDTSSNGNCVLLNFTDDDIQFSYPSIPPNGYKSSVTYLTADTLITCGTSGIDVSFDSGITWKKISDLGFHAVRKAKEGNRIFLAGGRGRIAEIIW